MRDVVQAAVDAYDEDLNLDVEKWLANEKNVAIVSEDGSVGMFEYERPGIYTGHYFFTLQMRGKRAKSLALEMLSEMYDRGAELIRGLTPLQNLAARWMTRQLGFTSHGVVTTLVGPCEIFIQTRDEFIGRQNG